MKDIEQLIKVREQAMEKVRAWWDADQLAGRCRDQTKAPAWPEYLAAFAALDEARTVALSSTNLGSPATGTPSREPTGEYTITPAESKGAT